MTLFAAMDPMPGRAFTLLKGTLLRIPPLTQSESNEEVTGCKTAA
jgi:hypothetical protein